MIVGVCRLWHSPNSLISDYWLKMPMPVPWVLHQSTHTPQILNGTCLCSPWNPGTITEWNSLISMCATHCMTNILMFINTYCTCMKVMGQAWKCRRFFHVLKLCPPGKCWWGLIWILRHSSLSCGFLWLEEIQWHPSTNLFEIDPKNYWRFI